MNHFCRPALCLALVLPCPGLLAQDELGIARYSVEGALQRPADLASWVHMGSSLGSDYRSDPFDPARPGVIGVVQMEPAAYRYFVENGHYADGSMFLLSFYSAETNSNPRLQGFVQGNLQAQEIHVIDAQRFADGRAFFMFRDSTQAESTALPAGNDCVQCHESEGDYNGTFMQFYPALRSLPRE